MKRLRVFNITLTVLLSLSFILLGVFHFGSSYLRLFESLGDLWESVRYFFVRIFGLNIHVETTVNNYSEVLNWNIFLAEDFEAFKTQAADYFSLLFSGENFSGYMALIGDILVNLAKILAIAIPCVLVLILAIKKIYQSSNTKHNKDTVPLRVFKWISSKFYHPIKRLIHSFVAFLKEHGWIWKIWLFLWVVQLNLATIIIDFFAFYFYFVVSFKLETLYIQVCKLFIDLQVAVKTIPIAVWLIVGYVMFAKWRKKIALGRLNRFEARNCGFINELPIVSMSCGSMGKKKTTLITDMALSQEVMFRQKAFDLLQKNDMKFPNFPWICFEQELKACMEHKTVYNLATIKEWIKLKRKRFDKHQNEHLQLYGYDYKKYGTEYYDGLQVSTLFDILERYALLYFIYVIESSLIVANYSIRTDNRLLDSGNFPMWYTNFFPEQLTDGRHAKILDFDTLRLGKKVIEENPNIGSFEFGVVVISEVGKERGNNLELREMKKGTDETNQKNDLFNAWLKMCRHSATVDNFPFIKVFTDEQRPESWGADARDLCDVIHIVSSGETKLAMPFYTIEDMLSEWAFNGFIGLYYDFRFRRGDNTLLVHILKALTSFIWRRNMRIYNKYGYSILRIEKERGTMDGKIEKKRYFIMSRKIYSRRFSTDCFSDYFNELAKNTKVGLADYREYATEKATVEELKLQNSYFINSLYK
jgi:hypothetical protein